MNRNSTDCDAAFKKRIMLECFDAFERYGFTRFRKFDVDFPIHDGFHCWVGLNTALYPDKVELTPNIGLHVVPIEKMVCALDKGEYATEYDRGIATYAVNIGELDSVGNERAFAFSPQQSDSFIYSECDRLASIYATSGLQYTKSIASYESLAPLIKKRVSILGGNPERYAACLYLMGRKAEAQEFLNTFPEQYKEFIKGFSIPFLQRIEAENRSQD